MIGARFFPDTRGAKRTHQKKKKSIQNHERERDAAPREPETEKASAEEKWEREGEDTGGASGRKNRARKKKKFPLISQRLPIFKR